VPKLLDFMMNELALELDKKAQDSLKDLMKHYGSRNRAEIISKALTVLKTVAHIERTHGELVARKGNNETKIIVR
jgi:hypothetical protein